MNLMPFRVAVLILISATLLTALEKDSVTPAAPSREVLLDVVVRDRNGRLVRDLTADEVHITDDGAAVKPAGFRLIGAAESAVSAHPRLITLVFEKFGPEGRALAREGALALLKDAARANVHFSVIVIGAQPKLEQNFTADGKLVQAAIVRATSSERATSPSRRQEARRPEVPTAISDATAISGDDVDAVLARMLFNAIDPAANSSTVSSMVRGARGGPSIQALLMLAREERAVPGRKTLVYFCEGLQVSESQRQQFQEILEAANRANLSIYPIDVSGLGAAPSSGPPSTGMNFNQNMSGAVDMANLGLGAGDVHRIETPAPKKADADAGSGRSALGQLAARTGGFLVSNTFDIRKPARRIAEESLTYYEVTYVPPPAPLDGQFRTVAVTVARPKLSVQSRDGYVSVPVLPGDSMEAFEVPLFKELEAQSRRHDFYHSARIVPLRPKPGGIEYAILVETILGDLRIQEDMRSVVCRIHGAALAVVRDAGGKIVSHFALDGPFQGPLDRKETYRNTPWLMEDRTVLPPGSYTLETVVSDLQADRASVQRRSFKVEPWDTPGKDSEPHVSALTYVRSVISTTGGMRRAFQSAEKVVEPRLELRLAGGKGSAATTYFVVQGAQGSPEPLKAELKILRGGREIARGLIFEGTANSETPLLSTLDASSFPGGEYELQVQATQGGKTSGSSLPLTIDEWRQTGEEAGVPATLKVAAKKLEEWDAAPPTAEQKRLLEAARGRALGYTAKLPNFICLQTTRRLEDPTGSEDWRQKDEYSEVITWLNGIESYSNVGGRTRSRDKKTDPVRVTSAGEFGSVLRTIFLPESKADFRWVRSESLGGRAAEAFAFRIEPENSQYNVNYFGKHAYHVKPGYHGIVTIDGNTAETLHLEMGVQDLPVEMGVEELRVSVDYDSASVAGADYLLPSTAGLVTRLSSRLLVRNEMRFSGYRRFDTDTRIQYTPDK
jgi:VWFA-related protein